MCSLFEGLFVLTIDIFYEMCKWMIKYGSQFGVSPVLLTMPRMATCLLECCFNFIHEDCVVQFCCTCILYTKYLILLYVVNLNIVLICASRFRSTDFLKFSSSWFHSLFLSLNIACCNCYCCFKMEYSKIPL